MYCSVCHNPTTSDGICPSCGSGGVRPTLFGTSRGLPGMYCGHCGSSNHPGWFTCSCCGALNPVARARRVWAAAILAAMMALAAFLMLAALSRSPEPAAPMPAPVVAPIPVYTSTVVVSTTTSDNGSQSSMEVVQTNGGTVVMQQSSTTIQPEVNQPVEITPAQPAPPAVSTAVASDGNDGSMVVTVDAPAIH